MDHLYSPRKLVASVRRLVQAHDRYTSVKRYYFGDDLLFMREAHLISVVGSLSSPTMSEISKALGVTPGAVSQLANRMEEKGYICRTVGTEDKRQSHVHLTERGERFYQQHQAYDQKKLQELSAALECYSPQDLDRYIEIQNIISQLLEETPDGDR